MPKVTSIPMYFNRDVTAITRICVARHSKSTKNARDSLQMKGDSDANTGRKQL